VTHWSNSINDGRGGFSLGATDHVNQVANQNLSSNLYNNNTINLFSNNPADSFPDYERYIGENYSCESFDDLAMLQNCNTIVENTGYPVVVAGWHGWNNPPAIMQNAPVFQMIYALEIEKDGEPDKALLASILLPPYWSMDKKKYPIICNSMYDISMSFWIATQCAPIMDSLLDKTDKRSAIMVYFNGGGSKCTYGNHRSFFDNTSKTFDLISQYLNGDIQNVVAYGISRGATSAIRIASNPYHDNYTVKHVFPIAMAGEKKVDGGFFDFQDYKTVTAWLDLGYVTGFRNSFFSGWIHPVWQIDNILTFSRILYGTLDTQSILDSLTIASPLMLQNLARKGSKVHIFNGTNDYCFTSGSWLQYVNNARDLGIDVSVSMAYRSGHLIDYIALGTMSAIKDALFSMLNGTDFTLPNESRFRCHPTTNTGWHSPYAYEEIFPVHEPFYVELPRWALKHENGYPSKSGITFVGEPGAEYRLCIRKIDETKFQNDSAAEIGNEILLTQGIMRPSTTAGYDVFKWTIDTGFTEGTYLYHYYYRLAGSSTWTEVHNENITRRPTIFENNIGKCMVTVLKDIPSGADIFNSLQIDGNATIWGMSEE